MALTIPVAHDFICPWCWVGLAQAKRLQQEFDVQIDWRGFELFPKALDWPDYKPESTPPPNKPPVPTRFDFLLVADGIELPKIERPHKMRTYNAHQALEYAKTEGVLEPFIEALYKAYWEQGLEINDPRILRELASPYIRNLDAMMRAIESEAFVKNIYYFDDEAHEEGIYNVPTFWIAGKRYAEQPYAVLRQAVAKAIEEHGGVDAYFDLEFPLAPSARPYTYINMVQTIDGKTVSGYRHEGVQDLGSETDHLLMKRIERSADAVLVGATTLRSTSRSWNPAPSKRIVVTRSGNIPEDAAFTRCGDAYMATGYADSIRVPGGVKLLRAGETSLDFRELLTKLRQELGIQRLLVTGGSEVNGQLLKADLVDELFVTITPKIKLGVGLPTYADGEPFARDHLQKYGLVEHHVIGNEIFVRYRRDRGNHR